MPTFWDERYAQDEYVYGTEPNEFFKQELDKLRPGRLLLPAEGEGRNAVYAAGRGWQVTAFDNSTEGKKKAGKLALRQGVEIDYRLASYEDFQAEPESFDALALIYAHSEHFKTYYPRLLGFLKKGGTVILEGFSKQQIHNQSGGPKSPDMLFSVEEIRELFQSLQALQAREETVYLSEGRHHSGKGDVIRLTGRK